MLYAVRWEGNINFFINTVQLTGVPLNSNQTKYSWRILLESALDLIHIAEMYQGRVLESEPPKRRGEFVYFEVIFKSIADCNGFLNTIKNKSS